MERIPASERTRERLKALMEGRAEATDERSELVRLAARLIIEEALEGEAGDALGRDYYARGAAPGTGYRNGYRTGRLKTPEGPSSSARRRLPIGRSPSGRGCGSGARAHGDARRAELLRLPLNAAWRFGDGCAMPHDVVVEEPETNPENIWPRQARSGRALTSAERGPEFVQSGAVRTRSAVPNPTRMLPTADPLVENSCVLG
jgi:hypothetical protein